MSIFTDLFDITQTSGHFSILNLVKTFMS